MTLSMDCAIIEYFLGRRARPMRVYYLDESEGRTHFVRSAIGINAEDWNEAFALVQAWRKELMRLYHIPLFKELHASDLLALRGKLVREGHEKKRLGKMEDAAKIFASGLERLEILATSLSGGLDIINVSLEKQQGKVRETDTLDRILNRVQRSVSPRHAFLIFDEGKEKKIKYYYRKARVYNPIKSKFGQWETGEEWKNIPIRNIICGPTFRNSAGDYFIQMADFVAHALLKQDEQPPIDRIASYKLDKAFGILDVALNKQASEEDPQGVVRR